MDAHEFCHSNFLAHIAELVKLKKSHSDEDWIEGECTSYVNVKRERSDDLMILYHIWVRLNWYEQL